MIDGWTDKGKKHHYIGFVIRTVNEKTREIETRCLELIEWEKLCESRLEPHRVYILAHLTMTHMPFFFFICYDREHGSIGKWYDLRGRRRRGTSRR